MIYIDPKGPNGQNIAREFKRLLTVLGVKSEVEHLPYGDFALEGYGGLQVGIERKTLHDMLRCIDDSRFSGFQKLGLRTLYAEKWLLLEGWWRPHDPHLTLMESKDGQSWWECRPGGRRVMYNKLRRYIYSIERSGVPVCYTRDMWHTAVDIHELYHYYQKREHTSQLEKPKLHIPTLQKRPSLTRRWAEELDGIGLKHGDDAEKMFKTPIALATSEEMQWLGIHGIGIGTATKVVSQIQGR